MNCYVYGSIVLEEARRLNPAGVKVRWPFIGLYGWNGIGVFLKTFPIVWVRALGSN